MNEKQLPTQLTDTTDIVLVAVVVVVVAFPINWGTEKTTKHLYSDN